MADANEVEYGNAASKVRFEEEVGKLKNRQGETVIAVNDDQNVGIGTEAPTVPLEIQSAATNVALLESSGTTSLMQFKGNASTSTGCRIGASQDDLLIQNAGAGNITLALYGTDALVISRDTFDRNAVFADNLTVKEQGDVRFADAADGEYVGFQAPTTISSSHVYTWPAAFPGGDKILQSDSSGVLTWEDAASGGGLTVTGVATGDSPVTGAVDTVYIVNSSGGNVEIDLPAASGNSGKTIDVLHKTTGNDCIIDPAGVEEINGSSTSITMTGVAYQNISLICDGTEWYIR